MRSFSLQIGSEPPRTFFINDKKPQYANQLKNGKSTRKNDNQIFKIAVVIRRAIKKRKIRQKILQQWHTTQNSYYIDLWIMNNFIKKPMEEIGILKVDESILLFPQIQGMIKLSQMMLTVLQKALKTKKPFQIKICKQINSFVNAYKIYGGYFNYHSKSSKILAELSCNYQSQMKQLQARMQLQYSSRQPKKQKITIKDCMQQPFYRLFKYVLLLKQYIKKLPKYHPDYAQCQKCHNSFHQINNYYNNLMKRIEQQEKKTKLSELFGQAVIYRNKQNNQVILQMSASLLFCDVRIYIFNDLVLVSNVYTILGIQKQQKYGIYQLNQFSYVSLQDDLKYYKNMVMLISKQKCIHFFFNDANNRLDFYKCLQKNIRQLRLKQKNRRSLRLSQNGTPTFDAFNLMEQQFIRQVRPQFIIQCVGCQIRPIGTLTNDSVYYLRIMIPFYQEDELNYQIKQENSKSSSKSSPIKSQNSSHSKSLNSIFSNSSIFYIQQPSQLYDEQYRKNIINFGYKCINQKIQLHFNTIMEIYRQMKSINTNIPDVDQPLNESAYSVKGKRKTKSYELRRIFIQQFFNFVLRNFTIMANPIWFINKLRINPQLWNYTIQRNSQITKPQNTKQKINYSQQHCILCKKSAISSIDQFEHLRHFYFEKQNHRQIKQNAKYCFNFFNLLRINFLSFHHNNFNSIQRILAYYHYEEGRVDYVFFPHKCDDVLLKLIKIYIPTVQQKAEEVFIDSKSTVGQVLDQLANVYQMTSSFDFDLMATYKQKFRILDRDQFLIDIIKSLNIPFQQYQGSKLDLRKSKSKQGLISTLKSWGSKIFENQQQDNKIYFIKTTYLHKSLQLKSFAHHRRKRMLQIQKIFWMIKKGIIKPIQKQLYQFGALFYCIKQFHQIQSFNIININSKILERVICDQYNHLISFQQGYIKSFATAIMNQKNMLMYHNKNIQYLYSKTLQLAFQKQSYISCFIDVQAKQIPAELLSGELNTPYILGINHKNLIIQRVQGNTIIASLAIEQIQFEITVFSIYITHQKWSFRFDGKMLYQFGQMIKKYQKILMKFPQHMVE